jgi:hypothetical protein
VGCRTYNITILGTHERCCRKCGLPPRGQDMLDRSPALPEPLENASKPVVIQDVND